MRQTRVGTAGRSQASRRHAAQTAFEALHVAPAVERLSRRRQAERDDVAADHLGAGLQGEAARLLADRKTMAIVLVEQYYDFAADLADQYLVMERGAIVQRGRGADMHAEGVRERMAI